MKIDYKDKVSFEKRLSDAEDLLRNYPDRVPIIVEKRSSSSINPFHKRSEKLAEIKNNKFLVPKDLSVGQLFYIIRKNLTLKSDEALYLFINNKMPVFSATLGSIYQEEHDQDKFLYVLYSQEETFG
ncbi:gamma-aminobutyric acid receptor-associated [Brachionus plicatilis]|uniref:Gamma-aminobutyric acid receptor-associated n=1 Tax=Brachionus plicatilis TaxID=10195 RepID=A0A3M7QRA3_BRAPC|nr:gamma-aminobutyric acid receptor-associated [Brachionus plicatilis]